MAQLSREEILDVAVDLLDHGAQALTMRSLADRLGVSTAAFYYWFPSKAQLLEAIAEHVDLSYRCDRAPLRFLAGTIARPCPRNR